MARSRGGSGRLRDSTRKPTSRPSSPTRSGATDPGRSSIRCSPTAGSSALNVTVRLFASYKEKAGTGELRVELPDRSAVSDLANEVLRLHPSLISDVTKLVVAVNEEYQEHSHELREGDEVALIPPVSGGSLAEYT